MSQVLYTCKNHTDDYDFCPICEIHGLNARIQKLEKAIAIYMRKDDSGTDFEFDSDAIRYFCEKYND